MSETITLTRPMPITNEDLADIIATAEMASTARPVVLMSRLCRSGAILHVHGFHIGEARDLVAAAGYTVRVVQERLVVTGAIDRLAQALVIRQLQARCARLEDDLDAAEHQVQEIRDACADLEYGLTEASLPDEVRERLVQLQEMQERAEHAQDDEDMPVLI
ncbi:hypothetical protein DFP74_6682 [Nocardiopsis sp. Huas11]|uniref:hypothetical protein n=1 Tax=Nocardiopsis sp. Huas11 TaxID=2183912 RepID=UPI000EAE8421|nr:hypothetical protein [Nocardiopsis sp. Huas11]RKR98961.1 hypothetical protein DFP74_6682 [Nocardiopsis sp. Huas11]